MSTAEGSEVSYHEAEVARVIRGDSERWWSNTEIAKRVRGVTPRTVRAKTGKLVSLGLCDVAEVFPHHFYRWSAIAKERNGPYLLRLEHATDVLSEYMKSLPLPAIEI